MKTLKILFAAVVLVGFTTSALAQNNTDSDSDELNATAVILADLNVTQENDLDFGQLFPGEDSEVALDNESAGRFLVDAADGSSVTLELTGLGDLALVGDSETTLPTTFTAGWAEDDEYDNGATEWTDPNQQLSITGTPASFYVFLGGTVTPDPNQTPGTYEKEITLTAEYN